MVHVILDGIKIQSKRATKWQVGQGQSITA